MSLEVSDLRIDIGGRPVVDGISFDVPDGARMGLIGESGSGKSLTALAILGLLPDGARATGSVRWNGREILGLPDRELAALRGDDIGMVFQEPRTALNPIRTVGRQIGESVRIHERVSRREALRRAVAEAERVALPEPERIVSRYPHQLSGGQRQRVAIAMALACRPRLLIADEPTSALDVTVQQTILDQIDKQTNELGAAVLLITHDLGLAAERASKVVVMHRGRVVEQGPARQILENPQHSYTKSLVAAAPSVAAVRLRPEDFRGDRAVAPARDNIVEIESLTKVYPVRGRGEDFRAVDDVSLAIPRGQTVAIVGESGSGKTTTARMLLNIVEPTSGSIRFDGHDVGALRGDALRQFRQKVQPIFQDPYSSLNPMFTIERIVEEPLSFYKRGSKAERSERVRQLMDDVALPASMLRRYPSELSGGQRQRVAIARALALSPELIVCDEPVSALDVLVQAQILDLLGDLQREYGLSYLFISHDLAVVRLISDYVCVMKDGRLVEAASSEEVFTNPRDPYTRRLLSSIPGNELGLAG